MNKLTKTQQRAQDIIDGFRGLPGEFMMLKGLLCLSHTVEGAEEKRNGYQAGSSVRRKVEAIFDSTMIAARMDEINNGERAAALHGVEVASGMHGYIGSAAHKEDVRENAGRHTA